MSYDLNSGSWRIHTWHDSSIRDVTHSQVPRTTSTPARTHAVVSTFLCFMSTSLLPDFTWSYDCNAYCSPHITGLTLCKRAWNLFCRSLSIHTSLSRSMWTYDFRFYFAISSVQKSAKHKLMITNFYKCACVYVCIGFLYTAQKARTKSFLESSGCQTRPLQTSGYQPQLTQMGENQKVS